MSQSANCWAQPCASGNFGDVTQLLTAEKTAYALLRDGLAQFTSGKTTSGDRYLSTVHAVTWIDNVTLRSLVAPTLAVEARHAAYLNARIREAPFWMEREDLQAVSNPIRVDTPIAN